MSKKFIYFPSFSVGSFSNDLKADFKLRNELTIRFYSERFPEKFRHPYFLVTAGHFYKKPNFSELWEFDKEKDLLLLGDSGGFQIASGAIKFEKELVPIIFNWLEKNSNIAMNLDIPPKMKYNGKMRECLELSKANFKYFEKHQSGKTDFLNVLQGDSDLTYLNWYKEVKDFEFSGWGVGGCGGSLMRFMSGIMALMEGKEQYKKSNKYIHILGTSKITDFFILSQLQHSLNKLGSNIIVTTDSSTPSRGVVYGLYYYDCDFRSGTFRSFHVPKDKAEGNKNLSEFGNNSLSGIDSDFQLPRVFEFDDILKGQYTFEDIKDYTYYAYNSIVLHNFLYFKDVMEKVDTLVYGHPYFLEQAISKDMFLVLKSIDEMVLAYENGTTPKKVFEKYRQLYTKLSTIKEGTPDAHEYF